MPRHACGRVCRATGRGVQSPPRGARGRVCRSCGGGGTGGRVQAGAHAVVWGTKKRGIRGRFGLHPTPGMSCTAPCAPCTVSCAHVRDALHHVLCHARVCAVRHVLCHVRHARHAGMCVMCARAGRRCRCRAQLPACMVTGGRWRACYCTAGFHRSSVISTYSPSIHLAWPSAKPTLAPPLWMVAIGR